MKPEITARENLTILSQYIIDAFSSSVRKEPGVIQLDLTHAGENLACHFISDGRTLAFSFGSAPRYDARLTAALYDWLDLAAGRLHPVRGVLTGRLKFEGNTKVFDRLIKRDLFFTIAADTADPPTRPAAPWRPPERILVINGSPRGNAGYTFHYLNRFIRGLQAAGGSVETIDLGRKKVNPCAGCFQCWKNDTGRCVQKDDGNDVLERSAAADLIVYAFTLYWDTVPGILKNFIERAFCLEQPYMISGVDRTRHPRRSKKDQSVFIFSVCGFPEPSHFDPVKSYFRSVCHNAHQPYLGGLFRPACMFLPNDPVYFKTYNRVMEAMTRAGSSLYRHGKIEKRVREAAETAIDPEIFRLHTNKFWENVVHKKSYFVGKV